MTLDVIEVDELGVRMTCRAFVLGDTWVRHAAVVVGAVDGGGGGAVEGGGGVYLGEGQRVKGLGQREFGEGHTPP